jgi:hypothetical protein
MSQIELYTLCPVRSSRKDKCFTYVRILMGWLGAPLEHCRRRLVIVCILLDFCRIASSASPWPNSTPERCHPEDVLLSLTAWIAGYGRGWPAGRAANVDVFVRGVVQGSRYEARLSLRKLGVAVHEEWLQFPGAVEKDDQAQRISFAVPPLPAGRYTEHLEVYDACGLAASLSASDDDAQRLRLLAQVNRVVRLVDVEEADQGT